MIKEIKLQIQISNFFMKVIAGFCVYQETQSIWLGAAVYLSLQVISNCIRIHCDTGDL